MRTLHLFAGAGGGIIADMMLGHTPVGAVEINKYCRDVLRLRQEEGWLPEFPIFEDVRSYSGKEVDGVDMVCGGFPCQDISAAGLGKGIGGERSGLFFELVRIVDCIRPGFIFLENSPLITTRGLDSVLREMAKMGYDAEWTCLSAGEVGAKHKRERWWCLCKLPDTKIEGLSCWWDSWGIKETRNGIIDSGGIISDTLNAETSGGERELQEVKTDGKGGEDNDGRVQSDGGGERGELESCLGGMADGVACELDETGTINCSLSDTLNAKDRSGRLAQSTVGADGKGGQDNGRGVQSDGDGRGTKSCLGGVVNGLASELDQDRTIDFTFWSEDELGIPRVADGVRDRINRLKAIGNGQVPLCAAVAQMILMGRFLGCVR